MQRQTRSYGRWLLLLVFAAIPMLSLVPSQSTGATDHYDLLLSLSSSRSNPVLLEGQTVAGHIYVFTAPDTADIARVRFWLDDPTMSGPPRWTESNAPYDFAGGSVSTANPFDTTSVADGSHSITAAVEHTDGTQTPVQATFTVDNTTAPPVDTTPPAAPTGLVANEVSTGISLNWNDNSEADLAGYQVYRSASASGPFTEVTATPVTSSAYIDATAPEGTSYYQVTATDLNGNESEPSDTVDATRTSTESAFDLLVSTASNRSNPVPLGGQTVSGNVYVFTSPDDGVEGVQFWLDSPTMSGIPQQSEGNPPYDFAGGSVSTANPFDTTSVADGSHTITAALEFTDGSTEVIHASFTIANSGPALSFNPGTLSFSVSEAGADSQPVVLDTTDGSAAPFTVTDNASWLAVSPANGTTAASLSVSVDAAGLAAGTYTAAVTASASGYAPATLPISLTVSTPYDQVHLAWTDDPSTTMTVVWRTWDVATPSHVEYRSQGTATWQLATGALRQSGTTGTLHEVTITGLTPSTVYEYRVQGDDDTWSTVFSTRTAPSPGPADFDAIYLADTGLVGRSDGLATGTQQVIDEIAELNPLLVLPGGDYAYFDTDKRYGTLDNSIDAWFNQMQPVASQSPMMPTYGNHEALLQEDVQSWIDRFPTPDGLNGRQNYSFDIGDVHFVSIFAVFNSTGLTSQQLDWIEQDILAAKAAGQRWIIPYFHVSPFSDGTNHPSNLQLRHQLGPLFESLGVKLVISSHDQSYERTYPLVDVPSANTPTSTSLTCYTMADGVTWVKASPGGKLSNISGDFSPWATEPPPHWTAVRDNTMHHFLRIQVSASGSLRVEAYGVVGDGSPPVIQDSFEYTTGSCSGEPSDSFPTASISNPVAGSSVSGTVAIQVQANDSEDATGTLAVEVQVDSGAWQAASYDATSGLYEVDWDTMAATEGIHSLRARATDSAGQTTTTAPINVSVDNVEDPPGTYDLMFSISSNRSNPVLLEGQTVAGHIYVFTAPDTADIARVRFWLDDPTMSGPPRWTESNAPYDFAGGSVSTANPFNTGTISNGSHTITAAIELEDGTTNIVSASFSVANGT